jgi:hypothetical protein
MPSVPSPCANLNILLTRDKQSSPNLAYLAIGQYPNVQPTLDTVGYVTRRHLHHCLYHTLLSSCCSVSAGTEASDSTHTEAAAM